MKRIINLIPVLLLILSSGTVYAKIYVVVNKQSPVSSISMGKLKQLYLGQMVSIQGKSLMPVEYGSGNALQKQFTRQVLKLNTSLVMQYRSRLVFSGKGRLPKRVGSEGSMISLVSKSTRVIGFVGRAPSSSNVKVIKTL